MLATDNPATIKTEAIEEAAPVPIQTNQQQLDQDLSQPLQVQPALPQETNNLPKVLSTSNYIFSYTDVTQATETVLVSQGLFRIYTQNWVVFMRRDFDCFVSGEPHHAISFLLHLESGQFITRVWGKTIGSGFMSNLRGVVNRLTDLFVHKVPCIGLITSQPEQQPLEVTNNYIVSSMPYNRKFSLSCKFLAKKKDGSDWLCDSCVGMKNQDMVHMQKLMEQGEGEFGEELSDEDDYFNAVQPQVTMKEESSNGYFMKCEPDDLTVNGEPNRKRSKKEKVPGANYTCTKCSQGIRDAPEFVEHIRDQHPAIKQVQCKFCKQLVQVTEFLDHLEKCIREINKRNAGKIDGKFPCRHCPLMFDIPTLRIKHEEAEHVGRRQFTCDCCDQKFKKSISRRNHMKLVHSWGVFRCTICHNKFNWPAEFVSHVQSKHQDQETGLCDTCLNPIDLDNYVEHAEECKKKEAKNRYKANVESCKNNVKCRHCDKIFDNHGQRKAHEREHIGNSYTCDVCGYGTAFRARFKEHMNTHSDSKDDFKTCCELCGKKVRKENLKSHIEYVHEGKKEFIPCEECGMIFERSHKLYCHKNIFHSNDPRFACSFCGKRFGRKTEKEGHELSHKAATFCCNVCGKFLKTKKSLTDHQNTHTGENPYRYGLII